MEETVMAGATAFQLRDKFSSGRERYETGLKIKKALEGKGVLFAVNDSIDLALALEADAVHLGVKDIPLEAAKKIAPGLFFGYSCNTCEDCRIARVHADYSGVGPVYTTDTKKDLRRLLGPCGLAENLGLLEGLPAVAIGGINGDNCREISALGPDGVAVSSYICSSEKPYEAAKNIIKALDERI